jgi:hypothetical protein
MKIDWLERLKAKAEHPEINCQNCQKGGTATPAPKPSKPLTVPDQCLDCPDGWGRCHICPHGCKIPLVIGKQYPAQHIFH